jgi:predicted nucleic acid-binding protein
VTVFVDTWAWFAAVFEKDAHHPRAIQILDEQPDLVTTDHILVETWLLLKSRFNQAAAEAFCQRILDGWCRVEIASYEDLRAAETIRSTFGDQRFSLVDRTSFIVTERLGLSRAVAFDDDFVIYRYGPNRNRAFEVLR